MRLLSALRTKMASWRSKRGCTTSSPTTSLPALTQHQWETLSGLLSFLSSMAPSFTQDLATIHLLQQQIVENELREARAAADAAEATRTYNQLMSLPHRIYVPRLSHDGLQWVAVAEFQDGLKLVGRGDCPNAALMDYSNQWLGIKGE